MTMPVQKPGRSVQSVETPFGLIHAVQSLIGVQSFIVDLAADDTNTKGLSYYDEAINSLEQPWEQHAGLDWCWLNPPYAKLRPWLAKCLDAKRAGANVAVLLPSSTGATWWRDYVHNQAQVHFLGTRVIFVGHTKPYPKDLALLLYSIECPPGYHVWDWKHQQP